MNASVHTYTYTYTRTYKTYNTVHCKRTHMQACTHTHTHIRVHTKHTILRTHIHIHIYAYKRTHIHIHIYAYIQNIYSTGDCTIIVTGPTVFNDFPVVNRCKNPLKTVGSVPVVLLSPVCTYIHTHKYEQIHACMHASTGPQ